VTRSTAGRVVEYAIATASDNDTPNKAIAAFLFLTIEASG